jgi:hypothetical protein
MYFFALSPPSKQLFGVGSRRSIQPMNVREQPVDVRRKQISHFPATLRADVKITSGFGRACARASEYAARALAVGRIAPLLAFALSIAGCGDGPSRSTPQPPGQSQHAGVAETDPAAARRADSGKPASRATAPKKDKPAPRGPRLKKVFSQPLPLSNDRLLDLTARRRWVAVSTQSGRVLLFDGKTGKKKWASKPLGRKLPDVELSADGSTLLATDDQLSNYVWKLRKNKTQARLYRTWHRKHGKDQTLSHDGRMLIREDARSSVRWYELSTYKMKWLAKARTIAIAGDGRVVACRDRKNRIEVRSSTTGRLVKRIGKIPKKALFALDGKGKQLAHTVDRESRTHLHIIEVASAETTTRSAPLPFTPQALEITVDPAVVLVWSKKGLALVALESGEILLTRKQKLRLATMAQGRLYAVPAGGGRLVAHQLVLPPNTPKTQKTARKEVQTSEDGHEGEEKLAQ